MVNTVNYSCTRITYGQSDSGRMDLTNDDIYLRGKFRKHHHRCDILAKSFCKSLVETGLDFEKTTSDRVSHRTISIELRVLREETGKQTDGDIEQGENVENSRLIRKSYITLQSEEMNLNASQLLVDL